MNADQENNGASVRFKTVLVVDNDAVMLTFMRKMLAKAGSIVHTAQDGLAALDLLADITPDLIFVDLVMPNIDGRSLCQIIRSKPALEHIPIVIISAIAAEQACNASDLGANVCIAKGNFADITDQVQKLLADPDLLQSSRIAGRILGIKKIYPRRTTEELLDINRHYQIMLNSITNGILEVNANHRVIFANPMALSIFALAREQLLGSPLDALFDAEAQKTVLRLLGSSGPPEKRQEGPDRIRVRGREIAVAVVSTQPVGDSAILIMEDVTEREQARTALLMANRELDALAKSDGLTQIANRRFFDELLEKEWKRMRREKGVLTLMLFDVDHFKDFNDNYGHLWGDQCLRDVAQLIKATLRRPSDQAARYGGDEFVAVLPHTPLDGALHLAEEIQKKMVELSIRHEYSPVSDLVTLTVGIGSGLPHKGVSSRNLVSLADKALYAAKQNGRNCVVARNWELQAS
jgi:two-component system cell cycle response regulator